MRHARVAVNAVAASSGGAISFAASLLPHLAREMPNLTVFATSPRLASLREVGIRVVLPFGRRNRALPLRLIWEQAQLPSLLGEFDVLCGLGGFAVRRSPIPQAVVHHNALHFQARHLYQTPREQIRIAIERAYLACTLPKADRIFLLSNAARSAMSQSFFKRFDERVSVVHAAVPPFIATEDNEFPLKCEMCHERGFVLVVASWYPHKGLGTVTDGYRAAATAGDMPHLVIIAQDAPYRYVRRLKERLEGEARVRNDIHLFGGQSRGSVANAFRQAIALVSAATVESFPLTPVEGMMFAKPLILSDIPAHREVAGDAALYFSAGDAAQLASRLHSVVAKDVAEAMGRQSAIRGRQFTWSSAARSVASELSAIARPRTV